MGWEDRRYQEDVGGEGGGRFRAVLRRVFGEGDNPLTWSIPLYTAWGIRVRIHLVYVVWIIAQLLWSIPQQSVGFEYMAIGMASLLGLVLLHEYGHCVACRWVGGEADQILLWPLGGLAYCAPPPNWRADLITTAGGPAVNVLLVPIFAAALWAGGAGETLVFNPFGPNAVLASPALGSYWLIALWWLYYTNWVLLVFNLLMPMYPLDGARIVHALMWRRMGERRALAVSAMVGLVTAVVVGVAALVFGQHMLFGVALWCGFTCWMERRRVEFVEGDPALAGYDFSRGFAGLPEEDERQSEAAAKREAKRRAKEQAQQAEVDRILAKISASGMASLTAKERRTLRRASESGRGG